MTRRQSSATIEEAAAQWVVRLDSRACTDDDRTAFARWLASDTRCPGALLQAEALWLPQEAVGERDGMSSEKAKTAAAAIDVLQQSPNRRWVIAGIVGSIAASVAGALLVGRRGELYETTIGEVRRVPLADRSTMAVNTGSSVVVTYTAARRAVSVDRGEAWFRVTKDPAKTFVVSAGPVRVEAIGTAFSVRRRHSGADVMVTEGVVRVWVDGKESDAVALVAGSALFVSDTAVIRREPIFASAIERKLAWRSGQLNLEGETLAEAVDEFNRYSETPIVVRDSAVGEKRLYGVFRLDDPQGFARTAAVTLGAAAWQQDKRIMIGQRRSFTP